jgi:hypothetical protein
VGVVAPLRPFTWVLYTRRENAADPTFTALCWGALAAQFLFSDLLYQASGTAGPWIRLSVAVNATCPPDLLPVEGFAGQHLVC